MKKLLLIISSITIPFFAQAQFKTLAKSTTFEEPTSGSVKILKTEQGGTLFLHMENDGKLVLKNYDNNHKLVYNINVPYKKTSKNQDQIGAAFVMGNELVIFTKSFTGRTPTLSRFVMDLNNKDPKTNFKIEEIDKFDKINMGDGYAMVYGKVPPPDFFIRKDPNSDAYAVASFNTFASDRNERISVAHYNGKHEVLSKSFYDSPNDGYKYMNFLDLYVDGTDAVYVVARGMNTPKSGGDQNGGLFVGLLNKGASKFDMTKVDYPNAKNIETSILRYNPITSKFLLLTNKEVSSKRNVTYYEVLLTTFEKGVQNFKNQEVNLEEIDNIASRDFKKKEAVTAIPQSLYINDDGSYTLVLEENLKEVSTNYNSRGAVGSSRNKYYLNDIGIIRYDKDGKMIGANYLPKSQLVLIEPNPLRYSFGPEIATPLAWGFQFKSFQYIDAKENQYVLFNDIDKNQEKMQTGKRVTVIQGVGDCEGYYYKLSDKGIPEGNLVFKKSDKSARNLMLFAAGMYDKSQNEYITLKVTKGKAEIVWLQPE